MQLISNRINGIDYFPFFSLHAIENHVHIVPIWLKTVGKDDFFLIMQTYENSNFYINRNLSQCLPC